MAYFQFLLDEEPKMVDNTNRRRMVYGMCRIQPDTPLTSPATYTYTLGGLRAQWINLEPVNTEPPLAERVDFEVWNTWMFFLQWSPGFAITNVAITAGTPPGPNLLTVTCNNDFVVGDQVQLAYMNQNLIPASPAILMLNWFPVTIASVIPATAPATGNTGFTANVNLPVLASTAYYGLAVGQKMVSDIAWQGVVKIYQAQEENTMDELSAGSILTYVNLPLEIVAYRAEFSQASRF